MCPMTFLLDTSAESTLTRKRMTSNEGILSAETYTKTYSVVRLIRKMRIIGTILLYLRMTELRARGMITGLKWNAMPLLTDT